MKDLLGNSFHVGCRVARAVISGQTPYITICEVTRIENNKLYLDNSKRAILYPERLLIIDFDRLYQFIKSQEP